MVFKPQTFHGERTEPLDLEPSAELEQEVADALAAAGNVDASDIEVTAMSDRTVVLSGAVSTHAEREAAFAIASALPKVKRLDCRIEVKG